jgi:hypothetical protein
VSRPSVARRMIKCAERDKIRAAQKAKNDPTPVNVDEAQRIACAYYRLVQIYGDYAASDRAAGS